MRGLDWQNERYVRSPTRDTPPWMVLGWNTQNLWLQLQRKMDRAGVIELDPELLPHESIAAMLPQAPPAEIERGLDKLLGKGWLILCKDKTKLLDPEFLDREEASMSDRQRQHESRRRRRDKARLSQNVTLESQNVTETSQSVTVGHIVSHRVTPSLPVPSLPVPPLQPAEAAAAAVEPSEVETQSGKARDLSFPVALVRTVPEIQDLWSESRRKRRLSKKVTAEVEQDQIEFLAGLAAKDGPEAVRDAINAANLGGWQTIAPPRSGPPWSARRRRPPDEYAIDPEDDPRFEEYPFEETDPGATA